VCGNGIVEPGETCDDGNTAAGDCCSPTCQIDPDGTSCSDGNVCNGEEVCHGGHCEAPKDQTCQTSFGIAAVGNFHDNTVSLLDLVTGSVFATVPDGQGPWGIAVHPRGTEVWVTNRRGRSVSVIDLATRAMSATIPVGRVPLGIVLDETGTRAYVSSYGDDRVDVIDTATRTVVQRFRVDRGPAGMAFDPTDRTLYVASFGADTVSAIDPASGRLLARMRTPHKPLHMGIDAVRRRLYVSNFGAGSVTVIGLVSRTALTTIHVGRKPFGVAVDAERGQAWVSDPARNTMVAIDTAGDDVLKVVPTASGPLGVAIDSAGRVLVVSGNAGVLSILDPSGAPAGSAVVGDVPVAFGAFAGTAPNDCGVQAPRCETADPLLVARCLPPTGCAFVPRPEPDGLDALLDALNETITAAPPGSIRDAGTAQTITAAIDDARAALRAGGVGSATLRSALRRLVGSVRRGLRTRALQHGTGLRLLDLSRRARVLVPGTRGGAGSTRPAAGGAGTTSGLEARPR
jgi:YVTN family beta-propeller protein/cysteine-rich repeat protein